MSTERIERIRAEEARVGDRIKPPEGRAFYELTVAHPKPGLEDGEDRVELGTGWGSVVLEPGEIVERENWQTGDAAAEIDDHMRSRLDELADLGSIARGDGISEYSNDEILALDLAYGIPGPIPDSQLEEEAGQRLDEYPLCVEATITFEVVLGTGGPDDRLLFECNKIDCMCAGDHCGGHEHHGEPDTGYEIDRVLYRYSWTGSAERVLSGTDREVAEELARRVVPELAE